MPARIAPTRLRRTYSSLSLLDVPQGKPPAPPAPLAAVPLPEHGREELRLGGCTLTLLAPRLHRSSTFRHSPIQVCSPGFSRPRPPRAGQNRDYEPLLEGLRC